MPWSLFENKGKQTYDKSREKFEGMTYIFYPAFESQDVHFLLSIWSFERMSGKLPADYLYGLPGTRDCVEEEVCLEEEENGGDVDDAVFGIDEVGCLDYLLKRYPYNGSNLGSLLPPFCNHPNAAFNPVMDSVYANFPDNPNSASSGFGNLQAGDYASTSSEKCFEVILQKQSSADKFGLTLCYRPSDVQQDVTEVYISETWLVFGEDESEMKSPLVASFTFPQSFGLTGESRHLRRSEHRRKNKLHVKSGRFRIRICTGYAQ
ncbi:hypothetical protein ACTXT7_000844 [Hymenolepis weldensis]